LDDAVIICKNNSAEEQPIKFTNQSVKKMIGISFKNGDDFVSSIFDVPIFAVQALYNEPIENLNTEK
jgi:hypothetical protein